MKSKTIPPLCALLLLASNCVASNKLACDEFSTPEKNVENFQLFELMEVPIIMSASQQAECLKSAASIVSTISGEDLLNMGARDLIDALELIPGFNFGGIFFNTVGLGVRGVQADEGKLSVLMDGIILTEQRFGTTSFGSHFPVEDIDRIEVIRGPGSILHGNFAELGVINIITKQGHQLDGGKVSASYGRFEHGESSKNTVITLGKQWGDLETSFYGKFNESHRSDRIYHDANGNSFDMSKNNKLNSLLGKVNLRYKGLNLDFLIDEYTVDSRDFFADTISPPNTFTRTRFATYASKLTYQHLFNDNFKIDTGFDFSHQTPWQRTAINSGEKDDLQEKVSVDHYKFDIKATYSSELGHYLVIGNSFQFQDYQHHESDFSDELPLFGNYSVYTEAVYKTKWVNILGGLRFDWYSEYDSNISPRIALTKKIDQFHYKVLYSQAFHAPTGGNYQLNAEYNQNHVASKQVKQLVPEKTYSYELELGYQFQRNLGFTVNLFYNQIDNFFEYTFDEHLDDFYLNSDELSTWGVEAMLSYQHRKWGQLKVNYGFYQAIEDTSNAFKAIDSSGDIVHEQMNISFPTHKVSVNHNLPITQSLSFNHTLVFSSDRYGYTGNTLTHHDPTWIYNTFFRYKNTSVKGLEAGLGIYDVLNAQYEYVQLINGGHPALPGSTRELRLKLSYEF